jgi:hypothetical protein
MGVKVLRVNGLWVEAVKRQKINGLIGRLRVGFLLLADYWGSY